MTASRMKTARNQHRRLAIAAEDSTSKKVLSLLTNVYMASHHVCFGERVRRLVQVLLSSFTDYTVFSLVLSDIVFAVAALHALAYLVSQLTKVAVSRGGSLENDNYES